VRERLERLRRFRDGIVPAGEMAGEFDRQMKLLAQWRRRDGSLRARVKGRETLRAWSFERVAGAGKHRASRARKKDWTAD
jgi:hypothetical protein